MVQEQEDESFIYFYGILKHLLNINQLVRSIREASFDLFVASLKQLCPLLFALDHIHYSRWIPVFILDLKHIITDSAKDILWREKLIQYSSKKHLTMFMNKTTKSLNRQPVFPSLLNLDETVFLRKMENVLPEI